jgi:Ca2+-binding RTX toxin-like protein
MMNRDTFLAVLAMDSYNRGYGQGVLIKPGDSLAGQNEVGRQLGNATVMVQNITVQAQAIGFYALAYSWNGETVISYRGTDFNTGKNIVNDVKNGWSSFTGIGTNSQFKLAKDFFTTVTGAGFPVGTAAGPGNTTLTGHSLGGALAGYVGARGLPSSTVVFDPIPYGNLTWNSVMSDAFAATLQELSLDRKTVLKFIANSSSPSFIPTTTVLWSTFNTRFAANIDASKPDLAGIRGYYTEGEIASSIPYYQYLIGGFLSTLPAPLNALGAYQQSLALTTLNNEDRSGLVGINNAGLRTFLGGLSQVDLHSMPLLVMLKYGETAINGAWRDAASLVLKTLFKPEVAAALPDIANYRGTKDAVTALRDIIAYSAIDEGERPFGDTAIRALFDDTGDLGRVMQLTPEGPLANIANQRALANIVAQYAGALALNDVEVSGTFSVDPKLNVGGGILTLTRDEGALSLDLSNVMWGKVLKKEAGPLVPIGEAELRATYLAKAGLTETQLSTYANDVWGTSSTKIFDRLSVVFKFDATAALSERDYDRGDATGDNAHIDLFIGLGGDNKLTGTDGGDLIAGSGGADELSGGKGKDALIGGGGNDKLIADLDGEDDLLDGGTGTDTVVYRFETPLKQYSGGGYGGGGYGGGGYGGGTYRDPTTIELTGTTKNTNSSMDDFGIHIIGLPDPGFGIDRLISIEKALVEAGAENDTLILTNDVKISKGLTVDLGGGANTINLENFTNGVVVDLSMKSLKVINNKGSTQTVIVTGASTVFGGAGKDQLTSGDVGGAKYSLYGEEGNDTLVGLAGDDSLFGGDGSDTLTGGAGNDYLDGGSGNDVLLDGGIGDDVISGDFGDDNLVGGEGNDELQGDAGTDEIWGGIGNDTIYGNGRTYYDFAARDTLHGGEGNDYLDLTNTAGTVYGDGGNDTLFSGFSYSRPINVTSTLSGGSGNDVIWGLEGDTLIGGADADTFNVKKGSTIVDLGLDDIAVYFGSGRLEGGYSSNGGDTYDGFDGFSYRYSGSSLIAYFTSSPSYSVTILNFVNGAAGIQLRGGGLSVSFATSQDVSRQAVDADESLVLSVDQSKTASDASARGLDPTLADMIGLNSDFGTVEVSEAHVATEGSYSGIGASSHSLAQQMIQAMASFGAERNVDTIDKWHDQRGGNREYLELHAVS